jgi:amino acid adenylation domain-containing protein
MSMTTTTAHEAAAPPAVVTRLLGHLAAHAAERPGEPAVITAAGRLSWRELAGSVIAATAALGAHGIGHGDAVALATGRTTHAVTALLAVWARGATAVLTDERHPTAHLGRVLANSGAGWILAAELTPAVLGLGVPVLTLPDLLSRPGLEEATPESTALLALRLAALPVAAAEDDPAYVIHTSGSTGEPKGVDISFGNLEAFASAIQTLGLPRGGTGINAVSPAFDGWLWCTLLYLVHGNALGLVDLAQSEHDGPAAAIGALAPRVVCLTPSLLAACEDGVGSAEVIVAAGEPCPAHLAERHAAGRRMLNVYGPTEATIAATWADSARGDDLTTIGTAIPGYVTYVLGEAGQPVPDGQPGELYLGGPGIALGYRNEPELTARRFVTDPRRPGGRMYATGDLVRRRPGGSLEFLGRADSQVKVRGFRVELAEIERRAVAEPGVAQAAAYVLPGGQSIGLAVVPDETADYPGDAGLRDRLTAVLPGHEVPATIRRLDTLPLNLNGKTDRAALAANPGPAADAIVRAPATGDALLDTVTEIWEQVLRRPVASVDASFFTSGGHSLLAARMISALRRATGVTLSIREVLANPTVRACAEIVRARINSPATGDRTEEPS